MNAFQVIEKNNSVPTKYNVIVFVRSISSTDSTPSSVLNHRFVNKLKQIAIEEDQQNNTESITRILLCLLISIVPDTKDFEPRNSIRELALLSQL